MTYIPPMTTLSEAALALFRIHVERRGQIDLDDTNRETYRELTEAGLMSAGSTSRDEPESIYRLTREGFERKADFLTCTKEAV